MTKSQFEEGLRRSMMIDKLRAALTDWMAVSDAELEREYKQRNEKVKLQVVARHRPIPSATRSRSADADVAAYYDAHKAEYRMGEQRKIKYVLLDRDAGAAARHGHAAATSQPYYNAEHPAVPDAGTDSRQPHPARRPTARTKPRCRAQAEDVLKQAKAGADFAALATQVLRGRRIEGRTAATSTTSAAAAWSRSSRRRRSRCSRARSATWSSRSSASTSSRSSTSARR